MAFPHPDLTASLKITNFGGTYRLPICLNSSVHTSSVPARICAENLYNSCSSAVPTYSAFSCCGVLRPSILLRPEVPCVAITTAITTPMPISLVFMPPGNIESSLSSPNPPPAIFIPPSPRRSLTLSLILLPSSLIYYNYFVS